MNNMTVVYADAEEKYVKNVILYGKTADNYCTRTASVRK